MPTVREHRYAVQAFHSDYWWSDEFFELIATEVDERAAMLPEIYPSFQYMPMGVNSQWSRNDGMNSLSWRDVRAYVDDWMMVSDKNQSQYDAVATRMREFRERTKKYWQYKDGLDRATWMSPMTTLVPFPGRKDAVYIIQQRYRLATFSPTALLSPAHSRALQRDDVYCNRYANSTDLTNETIARQYFPNDYPNYYNGLRRLKAELDPQDLFSNKGTIPLPAVPSR